MYGLNGVIGVFPELVVRTVVPFAHNRPPPGTSPRCSRLPPRAHLARWKRRGDETYFVIRRRGTDMFLGMAAPSGKDVTLVTKLPTNLAREYQGTSVSRVGRPLLPTS